MKNKTIKLLILLGIICLSACSDESLRFVQLPSNATILAFGDSLTAGKGARPNQSYPAILQQISNTKVINAGISGEISQNGLKRLPQLLKKHQPDMIIICHGGNDILRKISRVQTKKNITQMIHLAKSQNIQVLLLAVPKPSLLVPPAKVYAEIAKESNVVLDNESMSKTLKTKKYKSDTYHPNAAGYKYIAQNIFTILNKQGALSQ